MNFLFLLSLFLLFRFGVIFHQTETNRISRFQVTQPAPDFKGKAVVDGQFKDIQLADYQGKYLVLFFYPLDFTFVCPTEIIAFSDRASEFRAIGEILKPDIERSSSSLNSYHRPVPR